ncbi:MAG TPA: hypothetical protein VJI52_00335 [Candidatus Nanoarchaeia archaeon]|nr:hypothetical protein [Candidatus Nanoarchaeia archaeon]
MLTEVVGGSEVPGGLKVPNFRRLEVENGYEGLMGLRSLYQSYIKLMTVKGMYRGAPEVPVFKDKLDEYLAASIRTAA